MPFPFVLPTTSNFSFSACYKCLSHPSLPAGANTYRGIVRDTLKKHKRLPPGAQAANLSLVVSSIYDYLPYLLLVDAAWARRRNGGVEGVILIPHEATPTIEWRPTLSENRIPGKEILRVKIHSLESEIAFTLSTLANAYTLQARAALQPLYSTSVVPVGDEERKAAIVSATKHLLDAASVYGYLAARTERWVAAPGYPDISPDTIRAQLAVAVAEATLLAVLKDDPYPAVVAQDRNEYDREWMYKAPDISHVRAHLYGRLCLAASEHALRASALCQAANSRSDGKLNEGFVRYIQDLRKTSRAKACRFFGIDADLGGQTGTAIGWLRAGLQELGVEPVEPKKGLSFGRFKKERTEKKEDRRVEKGTNWGADAGRLEETRVIQMLDTKWTKQNDTMNTQSIPTIDALLAQIPLGREIHTVQVFEPPVLDRSDIDAMCRPPDPSEMPESSDSSDEDTNASGSTLVAYPETYPETYPGTVEEYRAGRTPYF